MNRRIKELANQCWESQLSPIGEWYAEFDEEKFAELLIKECAETLKKDMELAHIQLIPLDFKMYANGRLQRTIEEHLGVKL